MCWGVGVVIGGARMMDMRRRHRSAAGWQLATRAMAIGLLVTVLLPEEVSVAAVVHSNDEFVRNMYRAILCREGDEAGIADKVQLLEAKTRTRSELIMLMRFSEEYQSTSTYLSKRGDTSGECGGCSKCRPGNAETTVCCPGSVQTPPGYTPGGDQTPFLTLAPYESCADCLVACPGGWASMEPNTGPAKCNDQDDKLECCSPSHPWGTYFLVFFFGFTLIYVVAGTVYGFQHGKDGVEALPNIVFWRDVSRATISNHARQCIAIC